MHLLHAEYPALSVRALCQWLGISRSWYYDQPAARATAAAEVGDVAVRDVIERIVLDFPASDSRRVTQALCRSGWPVTPQRVLRFLREARRCCASLSGAWSSRPTPHTATARIPRLLAAATLDRLDQA